MLYYQSPMHPWIKSDKPGKCPICGMDLVPVYENGESTNTGFGLKLNSDSVNVANVQTAPVERRQIVRSLRVAGAIEEDDTRHRLLSAYADGRIDTLFVNHLGAEVKAGEPLATYYSPDLITAEREFIALAQQKTNGDDATFAKEHERMMADAAQKLKLLGLMESQIQTLLEKGEADFHTDILAPMTGTVVARHAYEGQYVKAGDSLFEIADFSKMWFMFNAYERDLAWLKPGQAVDVTTPSVPGKIFHATVTFIDPKLNTAARSTKVRVEIPNPLVESDGVARRELLRGPYAEGVVHLDAPDVLAVPRNAVLSARIAAGRLCGLGNGYYEQRKVKLGRVGDEFVEVLDGLKEGDKVVTSGDLLIDAEAQISQSANN